MWICVDGGEGGDVEGVDGWGLDLKTRCFAVITMVVNEEAYKC